MIILIIGILFFFRIKTSESYNWTGLPKNKKGAFFTFINNNPGICVFVHQTRLKQNPIPLLEESGIPKDYYFIKNFDWSGKEYVGSLPPELFASAYKKGFDIKKYTPEQLSQIFKENMELNNDSHSRRTELSSPDYFSRQIKKAIEELQGLNYI